MNHAFLIWAFLLLCVETTTAISHGQHLVKAPNSVTNKKCIDKERRALLDFKVSTNEDPYGNCISTWGIEDECCKWRGVTCDRKTGHVTKLNLPICRIKGGINPSLVKLTYLTHLDLSVNYFVRTIPKSIGSLTKLRYLDLSHNNLIGTIPMSIGSFTELRYIDLASNDFSGTIPQAFGNLTNLRHLSLGYTTGRCTIENMDWLSNLSHLQHLQLDWISLAKANHWVNLILSLQNLTFLSLDGCNLSHVTQPYSSSSHNSSSSSSSIGTLYLGNNTLNLSMYSWLFPLTSNRLKFLDLSNNMLDEIPKYLGDLCNLTSLYFSDNFALVKLAEFLNNLSGCTSVTLQFLYAPRSQLTGSLSNEIENFTSLKSLNLAHNRLNGTISEKMWKLPMLEELDVSSNSLRGDAISKNIKTSKLSIINLSNNSFEVDWVPSKAQMSNLSYVQFFDLSSCKLGPGFPKWIQTLENLTSLNLANTKISDTISVEFWNTWPSQLTYLNLSSNNIRGEVPDLLSNFAHRYSIIDLSSNNFSSPISNVPSNLESLDLSKNKFYGGISFLCQIVDGFLVYLDLSNNTFSGQIPDCLWHFKELIVLNLAHNNLSGRLPASIGYLIKLEVLYLHNNHFSGELPFMLRNCTKLTFLDLGDNMFSGHVPVWIGDNLSGLYSFSLRSNCFLGPIPLQLCQLVNLQNLDLSMNNLHGTIPSCVSNLTSMIQRELLATQNVHRFPVPFYNFSTDHYPQSLDYADYASINWQGKIREFSSNLGLLKSIDLSSNNLTGQIPHQLTKLYGLLALNLSKNALLGEIPRKIGEMKELLTLDLSQNSFSGDIPSSMSRMTSLNYLDLSRNNLSGRIPSSTQLQSFEASRYAGNIGLCGPPVTKSCSGDGDTEVPSAINDSEGDGEEKDELGRWFYIGAGTGFATGLWIACSTLLLNRRTSHAFFHFLDSLKDWVRVKVVLLKNQNFRKVAYVG